MANLRLTLACAAAAAGCATAPKTARPASPRPLAVQVSDPTPAVPSFTDPERRARLEASFPELDAFQASEAKQQGLPSLAFGVVIDGALVFERGYGAREDGAKGGVDADTIYRIGSITKTFTGLALLGLRDEGKLSLDDPAARYLPELEAVRYPTRDAPPLTLRQILTHTSGLPRLGPFNYAQADHDVTEAEMLAELPSVSLLSTPGAEMRYSNFGFGLLGLVVSRVSGQRYRDYVSAEILRPLGMPATVWSERDAPPLRLAEAHVHGPLGPRPVGHWRMGASEAAGGLYSSVRDLSRYLAFQMAAYPPRSDAESGPVRRSSLREAHAVQRLRGVSSRKHDAPADAAPAADAIVEGAGLAWFGSASCDFEQIVGHDGGTEGYSSIVRFLPQRGVGLVALTNIEGVNLAPLTERAFAILQRTGAMARRIHAPSPALAHAMAGAAALYDDFRPASYAELFTPSYRKAVPDAAAVTFITKLKIDHGRCEIRAFRPVVINSPDDGVFSVPCEHGSLEFRISVNAAGKIDVALVESRGLVASPERPADTRDRCSLP